MTLAKSVCQFAQFATRQASKRATRGMSVSLRTPLGVQTKLTARMLLPGGQGSHPAGAPVAIAGDLITTCSITPGLTSRISHFVSSRFPIGSTGRGLG